MLRGRATVHAVAFLATLHDARTACRAAVGMMVFAAMLAAGGVAARPARAPITYTRDIAPIVLKQCATCHRPGEVGPFSLVTYRDVRDRARQIAAVTARRYMPPWKPDPGYGHFAGARRLADEEIRLLQQWAEEGAIEGDPADEPPRPTWTDGWQLGTPDLIVTLPEPFAMRADGPDVIRNFVLPLPVRGTRYVTAVEFRPGTTGVAHHATMLVDESEASRRLDADDPLAGYEGILPYAAKQPDGHFLGWTPGEIAIQAEPDMAWQLNEGSDLVVSLHMRPTGKPEPVRFSVGLFFGDRPPARMPYILQLGRQDLDIPADASAFVTEDRYVLPVDVDVRAVQPHAHYLCRRVEALATLPDGTRQWLIRIADWDFSWQAQYRYAAPIALPKGTVVSMRYTFDNSSRNPRNPSMPARRVRFGQRSVDEMAELLVQVLPKSAADRAVLDRDFRVKATRDAIVGYETMLAGEPDSVPMHNDVAMLYLGTGDVEQAIAHFEIAVRLEPENRAAHYNLAAALTRARKTAEAIAAYRRALALSPGYAQAHNNLGAALTDTGALDEAEEHYRRALALDPDYVDARVNLAVLRQTQGRVRDAIGEYETARRRAPRHPVALNGEGSAWQALGDLDRAMTRYREALASAPDYADARYNLGTALHARGRTGEAIETLRAAAAAYAATGALARAGATLEAALALTDAPAFRSLAPAIRQQLEAYRR